MLENELRLAMCAVFGFAAGVSFARAWARRSTVRRQLFTLGIANTALFAGQVTLFGTPWTIRAWFSAVVAVADICWLVSLFWHGPPTESQL